MDLIDMLIFLFRDLIFLLISLFLQIKESFIPSPSNLSDFLPKYPPKYNNECFYITFPCRRFQVHKTNLVIAFWQETCYVNHGDEFVFVEPIYDNTPWSLLTIRFRPRLSSSVYNYYFNNSTVFINSQTTQNQLTYIDNVIQMLHSLDSSDKGGQIETLQKIANGICPSKSSLSKLWNFIWKNREHISTVADLTSILGFLLSLF